MASNDTSLQAISNLFQAADTDHSGNLSRDEIVGIMQQIKKGVIPSNAEVNMCMALMDKDSDGVITKEEFTSAMAKWLGLDERRGEFGSPSAQSRKRAVSDLTKFFKQFDTVGDFNKQQELILQRERPELDHAALLHEFPVHSKEEKLAFHRSVASVVAAGKTCLLAELHSVDWNVVLRAAHKVKDLLAVVEVFHDPDERFELSSLIIQIFTGVTEVDDPPTVITSSGKPATSIIRRMCNLLCPSVPSEVKAALFPCCLQALCSYIIGPIAHTAGIPQGGSVWNPDLMLVKQVVEHEQLPMTLLKLLEDNFTITEENQGLLRAIVRCICLFSEHHSNCLEGMLRLGFRPKIVALLQQPTIQLPLLRSGLATLAVLCGHSHSASAAMPAAVTLSTKELFDVLYCQHLVLATLMQSDFDKVDGSVLVNVFTVLRYMLPLCSPHDKLFQAILGQLFHFLCKPWDLSQEISRHMLVTLNVCLEEVLLVSPLLARQVWLSAGFAEALLSQLAQSASRSDGSFTQLACSCLSVVNTLLIEGSCADVLLKPGNMEFIRRCASLVSSIDVSWYAMKFLSGCFKRKELLPAITASGSVDTLFASLLKFKSHSSEVSHFLGSHVGPVFNLSTAQGIINVLSDFLKVDVPGRIGLFSADNVESIGQLHGMICAAMTDGLLGLSDELVDLTKAMVALMEGIRDGHGAARSSTAGYISELVGSLLSTWNSKLNSAYGKHSFVVTSSTMDVDEGFMLHAGPSDVFVDITLLPSWAVTLSEKIQVPASCTLSMLENGLSAKYGTNVSLFKDQKMLNGQHIPISTQAELEAMYRLFVDSGGRSPVVVCVMPAANPLFASAQVRLSLQKGALYNAVGLVPKEVTLRELRNELKAEGVVVNASLMSAFYDYFNSRNVSEVNVEQFIECMTSPKLKFSEASARAMFNAFDADKNNLLSMKELGLGFAKMTDGSVDDKLLLMFQAYDTDRNNYLDINELTHMIHVASGATIAEANAYATSVIQQVDKNADAKLDFMEFRDAAYKQMIPVQVLWSEGNLDFIAGGGQHHARQSFDNQHKRRGDQDSNRNTSPRRQRSSSFSGPSSPGHHNHNRNNNRGGSPRQANNSNSPRHGGKAWAAPSSPRHNDRHLQSQHSPRQGQFRSQPPSYNRNRPPPLHIPKPAKVRAASPSRRGGNPFGRS